MTTEGVEIREYVCEKNDCTDEYRECKELPLPAQFEQSLTST
jgi:hypothetical protein